MAYNIFLYSRTLLDLDFFKDFYSKFKYFFVELNYSADISDTTVT